MQERPYIRLRRARMGARNPLRRGAARMSELDLAGNPLRRGAHDGLGLSRQRLDRSFNALMVSAAFEARPL